jgi:hypothetical protein
MTKATSIVVRLRRVTVETAYVNVPVTAEIASSLNAKSGAEAIAKAACLLGGNYDVEWHRESEPTLEVHPIQKPRTVEKEK